jgi:hypothetical protein
MLLEFEEVVDTSLDVGGRQVDFKEMPLIMVNPYEYILPLHVVEWLVTYIDDIGANILRINIFTRDHLHMPIEIGKSPLIPVALILAPINETIINCAGGDICISSCVSLSTGIDRTNSLTWRPHSDVITRILDTPYTLPE